MDSSLRPARKQGGDSRSGVTHIHQGDLHFGSTQVTGGSVLQGNFVGGITINSTAPARPDYTGQFSHSSSLEPVKAFVPRPILRDQIKTQLCDDAASGNTKTLVVWGLGGAGKTQIVLDYVQQYRTKYKVIIWIEAGQKESLERDFVNLYQTLYGVQMVAENKIISIETAVIGVKSWFSGKQGPWLMVFDGADTIENEDMDGYIDINHFIPKVASLHVILTSRSSTAKNMTRLDGVLVAEMEESQTIELFYQYSQLQRNNTSIENEVKKIVKELGYLALAVTLAATYVGRGPRETNIKNYLSEYQRQRCKLLGRMPKKSTHQYGESVLTTWESSYRAIRDQCPEASILLTLLCFLSFDDIFLQLFATDSQRCTRPTDVMAVTDWRSMLSFKTMVNIDKIKDYFETLKENSLIQWKEEQQSYVMHKLVHAWGYDRLTEDEQLDFSVVTFELIVAAVDNCGKAPKDKLRLVPHVMTNFALLTGAGSASQRSVASTLNELGRVGIFLTDIGRFPEGSVIKEFVLNERCRELGEEHPSTVSAMNSLACTLLNLGRLDEATKMFEEVLEKMRRILGEEHPSTILAMNNLANTLGDLGQPGEAVKILKEVLEKRRRILGEEHPSTISAMNNLANMLGDLGRLDEAAKMLKEVLEKRRRILGEEHPDTISAMNNLANTLGDLGCLKGAAEMLKEVLEKRRRILGEEHPSTISAMSNLASTLEDLDEAAKVFEEVLEKRRRILCEEHPSTISAMNNLATMLGDLGRLDEAIALLEVAVPKIMRIYGDKHPHTKIMVNNLARYSAAKNRKQKGVAFHGIERKPKARSFFNRVKIEAL